jgi:hypothetical protein
LSIIALPFEEDTNNYCGDWKSFKDEKCIKVLDKDRFLSFDEAKQFCNEDGEGATLLTMHSREELEFISHFLFNYLGITNDIWIGLRKSGKIFKWIDDSHFDFTNWAVGSPSNRTDYECVQMSLEANQIGEWTDKLCNRKNIVVCQKTPTVTLNFLHHKLLETSRTLADTRFMLRTYLNNLLTTKWINYKLFTDYDGKHKAFFIPMNEKNAYDRQTWDNANKTCAKFEASLVEVDTWQKQFLLETYLGQLGLESNLLYSFWLNGSKDLLGKWHWVSDNREFNYTNWFTNNPRKEVTYDHLAMDFYETYLGKWYNAPKTFTYFVICEKEVFY